jgi:hypothetical protein
MIFSSGRIGIENKAEDAAAGAEVAHDVEQEVACIEMQNEVEEWNAAEDDERIAVRESEVIVPGEQQ